MDTVWMVNVESMSNGIYGTLIKCTCHGINIMGKRAMFDSRNFRIKTITPTEMRAIDRNSRNTYIIKIMGEVKNGASTRGHTRKTGKSREVSSA